MVRVVPLADESGIYTALEAPGAVEDAVYVVGEVDQLAAVYQLRLVFCAKTEYLPAQYRGVVAVVVVVPFKLLVE
jgi:hypothetical protein